MFSETGSVAIKPDPLKEPEEDAEDELLHEVDVVLSQEYADSMTLVQYPLRPHWRGYDPNFLKEVRYKFGVQILEMDYDLSQQEIDEQQEDTTLIFDAEGNPIVNPTKEMSQFTVRSNNVAMKSNYAVGLYRNGQLFLTPIKSILQMRPSFNYIDSASEKKPDVNDLNNSMDEMDIKSSEALRPLQIQVKRQESEKAHALRLKSYAYLKQLENEDTFKTLEFINREKLEAQSIFDQITLSTKVEDLVYESFSEDRYIESINPATQEKVIPPSETDMNMVDDM